MPINDVKRALTNAQVARVAAAFRDSEMISLSAIRLINDRADDLDINAIVACIITKHFLEEIINESRKADPQTMEIERVIQMQMDDFHRSKSKG